MTTVSAAEASSSWIEAQYCASIAAALLARAEYFELLEDACLAPGRLSSALRAWRGYVAHAQALAQLPMGGERNSRN
ncbi:MAG TPA: hypothetical protein VFO44_08985 [Steroidobacteraceae bacterium]|nr:hypothetical protein [Steroidobacteraceae bacterium]